ncbi:Biotin carboxylase [Amycolatopsis tolypomycina]|uniref:Biotin carboxylase n=1 Tax=Amycolatopsis tolypomycina TaxID=208445 RepID=A0A1H4XU43_9PSEU|nr:ATP-grasp domain-containing protein [Amycolatopsis tolypomycina]SED08660.1 Biotin carboxylase [Amycolatopsis tolypomycina]
MPETVVLLNPRDLVVDAARRLGLTVVVVLAPGGADPGPVPGLLLHSPWTTDPGGLVARLRELDLPGPVSCFGFGEAGSSVAAVVNERLGWPGTRPGALETFRDKAKLRAAVGDRAGVPVAHAVCDTLAELGRAIAHIGFPCIVKPADGTGSAGVTRLDGPADAAARLAGPELESPHLVEEFLQGTEYSVEAMSSPRGHRILAVTEKATTGAPHFVETGHTLPVDLGAGPAAAVADLVAATLDAAGYHYGVSHTEVMLTGTGPRLIESHGRPGGDRISDMLRLALGEDVFEQSMAVVFGRPTPDGPARRRVAGIRYVTFPGDAPVPEVDVAAIAALPGVVEAHLSATPGARPPSVRQSRDRHGFVVAAGDTREELETHLARAVAAFTRGS